MKASKQIKSMVWGELRFIIGISEGQIRNADVPREPWIIILYFEINNKIFKLRARKKPGLDTSITALLGIKKTYIFPHVPIEESLIDVHKGSLIVLGF